MVTSQVQTQISIKLYLQNLNQTAPSRLNLIFKILTELSWFNLEAMFWGLWPCLLFLDGSLRYESSTLILCKELGSSIFHLWVSQSVSQICFTPLFFFSINSTYMKRILHFENVTPKSSYNWLKIQGFFSIWRGNLTGISMRRGH